MWGWNAFPRASEMGSHQRNISSSLLSPKPALPAWPTRPVAQAGGLSIISKSHQDPSNNENQTSAAGWLTSGKRLQLFSGQGRKTRAGPWVSYHCCRQNKVELSPYPVPAQQSHHRPRHAPADPHLWLLSGVTDLTKYTKSKVEGKIRIRPVTRCEPSVGTSGEFRTGIHS